MRTTYPAAVTVIAVLALSSSPSAAPAAPADSAAANRQSPSQACPGYSQSRCAAKRRRVRRVNRACNTWRCVRRIQARERRRYEARMRSVVAPYLRWLQRLGACESGNNPRSVSASGLFYGEFQFMVSTWRAVGGRGMPHHASRLEQRYRAVLLLQRAGRGQWPVCG